MMLRKITRYSFLALIMCWLILVFNRQAMASCTINVPTATNPMPLQLGNITVGADLADGTVLYTQTYNLNFNPGGGNYIAVTCSTPGQVMANYTLTQNPLPLSSWGSGQYTGKVYETGVPGIGVYIHQGVNGAAIIPASKPAASSDASNCATGKCVVTGNFKRWDVFFVKTGPVSSGTIIGANLPCVGVNYTNDINSSDNQVENICMTGTVNIVASTCKTPDVTVPMGKYDVSTFSGEGSATKWVNASIKLTDCPVYYGRGSRGSWYADGSGTDNSGTPVKNSISVKLMPANPVINSSQGIFDLSKIAGSASGVGIQLAYGTESSPELVNFGAQKTFEMDNGSNGISEIPLIARYIQTSANVTPGIANSAVTFMISYY